MELDANTVASGGDTRWLMRLAELGTRSSPPTRSHCSIRGGGSAVTMMKALKAPAALRIRLEYDSKQSDRFPEQKADGLHPLTALLQS